MNNEFQDRKWYNATVWWDKINKIIKSLILLSSKNGKSSEKGEKCICPLFELKEFRYCECILATLLQNRVQ